MTAKTGGTLILVDDEPTALQRLLSLLQDEYECHYALTGTGGLRLYEQLVDKNPVVVCDVKLPDMAGFDVCRAIKAQNPATYVMLLTAYNDSELRMAGLNAYADSYMDKVQSDEEIRLKVRNAFNTIHFNHPVEPPAVMNKAINNHNFDNFEDLVRNRLLEYYKQPSTERDKRICSLEAMADFTNQSPRTFQRKMQRLVGLPFKTFQLKVRLDRGRELLMDGFSVTQIAEILEFSSPSHFSRAFRDYYGMTPGKYKRCAQTQPASKSALFGLR
ncbi:MAG: hypothetical protein CSA79_03810 [Thiothrix nivea]|nr:MAG: hypothetical protein CSA79_03810 [Thiothrix nivea]